MTKELTVQQQKAIDLRDYLSNDSRKDQLASALPKWLSPDRFFRVLFSSILRNPALLDCTRESILQSVMACAQLGLEPILGRAYLVPYNNRKAGTKECQFQPGYQGLVDLARRSGTIADVYGMVVYKNDFFKLSFGLDRQLIHRPWYIENPEAGAGQPIGAYCVWILKDGTKHPEFMPISEIYKRREMSQAFRWAETGDKNKGGGRQDSIWHKWPEEMIIKTVVKHSSKLVPASIDFMQAIELDNEAELGEAQADFFSDNTPQPMIEDKTGGFEPIKKADDTPPPNVDPDTGEENPEHPKWFLKDYGYLLGESLDKLLYFQEEELPALKGKIMDARFNKIGEIVKQLISKAEEEIG